MINEARVVIGGETIIITLSGDTWVAAGATFDAQRQPIIDGLVSLQSESFGWNAVVRPNIPVTAVVRTSATVVTLTLPAIATYNIHTSEAIPPVVPGSAVVGGVAITATPTIIILADEDLMAWKSGDRVRETTTTAGAGTITLAGAVAGFQAFSVIAADQDRVAYAIVGPTTEWETGIGTWATGNLLQRTKILQSSNGGAAVVFSAGVKDVFCTIPAALHLLPANNRQQASDVFIPNRSSSYVSDEYEIMAGKVLELGPNAVLEIG